MSNRLAIGKRNIQETDKSKDNRSNKGWDVTNHRIEDIFPKKKEEMKKNLCNSVDSQKRISINLTKLIETQDIVKQIDTSSSDDEDDPFENHGLRINSSPIRSSVAPQPKNDIVHLSQPLPFSQVNKHKVRFFDFQRPAKSNIKCGTKFTIKSTQTTVEFVTTNRNGQAIVVNPKTRELIWCDMNDLEKVN